MMSAIQRWVRPTALGSVAIAVLTACGDGAALTSTADLGGSRANAISARTPEKVSICHASDEQPRILEVAMPALDAHIAHGDYVTTLRVDRLAESVDDGVHFRRIGDALETARAGRLARSELQSAACRITILISADAYRGSTAPSSAADERFPLIVDVPDITLRGALVMEADASGRAAGGAPDAEETILSPTVPLPVVAGASTPLIIANAHPAGSAGNGLTVEGMVFRSGITGTGAGGQGILAVRVQDLLVRGNRFESGFTESLDLRATSANVILNQLGGTAGTCDVCLAGPGRYQAIGNTLGAGGVPGITVSGMVGLPVPAGVEPLALTPTAETWAEVINNEVRDHLRVPVGAGLRVEAVGTMAPNVHNTIHAVLRDNRLVNNRFGILVHGGFPVAGTLLRGDLDVTLGGNTILGSCQAKLLVSLPRHQRTLGLNPAFPYLRNSTFQIDLGGDLTWDEAWFGHEPGFGNTLIVDGQAITNGSRQFYSATSCPGLGG